MAIRSIVTTIDDTTGAVTNTVQGLVKNETITGVVLREFMTNGPDKLDDGTYNDTASELKYNVKVKPNNCLANITFGSDTFILYSAPTGITQTIKAPSANATVNAVVKAVVTDTDTP
jgi:hypothetical protein